MWCYEIKANKPGHFDLKIETSLSKDFDIARNRRYGSTTRFKPRAKYRVMHIN